MQKRQNQSKVFRSRATTPQARSKTVWHPLSLQHLKQSQFIDVVNGILDGRHELCEGTLKGASGLLMDERAAGLGRRLTTGSLNRSG